MRNRRLILVGTLVVCSLAFASRAIGQERHSIVLRAGSKVFLQRHDYLKDKIHEITTKDDTVTVLAADLSFFQFKREDFVGWAITNSVNESDIIPNPVIKAFPVNVVLSKDAVAYQEGKIGSDKLTDLKKGTPLTLLSAISVFYECNFNDQRGFIVKNVIPGTEYADDSNHLFTTALMSRSIDQSEESYIRANGRLLSTYSSGSYENVTYQIGSTIYSITRYRGDISISTYTKY